MILRILGSTLVFFAAMGAGLLFMDSAYGYTYNRDGAAAYAHQWSSNTDTGLSNTAYQYYGDNDCANFASQVLYQGGGLPMQYSGNYLWWNDFSTHTNTASWSVAQLLKQNLVGSVRAAVYRPGMTDKYTSAGRGDVYVYEWGDDDGEWDNESVSSGFGSFANFVDPSSGKNYRSVLSGVGDYMSQHTRHRDYAPWNWGFWIQADPIKRAKMDTIILHIQ
jgi:hypothetical protein